MALSACSENAPRAASLEQRVTAVLDEQMGTYPSSEAIRAIEVTVDGRTVFTDYPESSADEYHPTFSVTKSVIGTLIGIALDEGLIEDVDEPLAALLPDHADRMSRPLRKATLHDVLTMTSGMPYDESVHAFMVPDPVAAALAKPAGPSGTQFIYSSLGSHVLGAVLVDATGRSVLDYAREKLFGPLDIDTEPALEPLVGKRRDLQAYLDPGFAWPVDAQGLHLGASFLKLRPGDMTKLGQLYLDGGRWQGEQVISEEWVRQATRPQVPADGPLEFKSYGYQWWVGEVRGHPAFLAWGYGGQAIEVIPALDLVTVAATEVTPLLTGPGMDRSALLLLLEDIATEVDR